MPDGTGYTVVPSALRSMAVALENATQQWKTIVSGLVDATLSDDALGLAGREAGYPESYNEVNEVVQEKLDEGTSVLTETAQTVGEVAVHYEKKDADWYEQFGYIEKQQ